MACENEWSTFLGTQQNAEMTAAAVVDRKGEYDAAVLARQQAEEAEQSASEAHAAAVTEHQVSVNAMDAAYQDYRNCITAGNAQPQGARQRRR